MATETVPARPGPLARRSANLVGWLTRGKARSGVALITAVLLGLLAVWFGASISIDTDLRSLLPASAPSVAALDLLEERKGSAEGFVIAIEAPSPGDANAMVLGIAAEVASWPETTSLTVERDYTPLRAHALYMLELEDLEKLRDELEAERKQAIARMMGPGLVEGEVDTSDVSVGDDWDDEFEELDWGAPEPKAEQPAPEQPQPEQPQPEQQKDEPPGEGPDLEQFLRDQREGLLAQGVLDPKEIALIWPEENERGEIPWTARVGMPYAAEGGKIRTIHASLSKPATDVQFAQDAIARVERRAASLRAKGVAAETRVQVVSAYNVSGPVNTILRDARRATWISASLVLAVLLLGFRNLRVLPLVMVPMTVAMSLTLAVAKLSFGQLNALTVFLFAVLFGMGVDFSVHLYALRERQGRDADWPAVIREHFRPLLATMSTTSASLLVLMLAEFKAFREFGAISAAGVVLCFVAAIILVPVIDVLIGPLRRAPKVRAPLPELSDQSPAPIVPRFAGWFAKARYVLLVLLAGVALYGAPKLQMEKDTRVLNASNAGDAQSNKEISYRQTGGRYKSLALVADSPEQLDVVVDRLIAIEESGELLPGAIDIGEPRQPWVKEVYSLRTIMPTDQAAKAPVIEQIGARTNDLLAELPDLDDEARRYQTHLEALERMAKADPLTVDELPDWSLEPFRESESGRSDRIAHTYLRIAGWSIDELVAVRERLDEILEGTEVRAADSRLVFADLMTLVERDAKRIPLFALGVILLFIAIDVRRVGGTLACFATLGLGVTLAVAVMGLWPMRLNFFNLVVMPAVVGLGIDASIHLWHGRKKATLAATGKASLLAAMTTVAGFSGLLAANHAGLRSIGEVGVMAIVACVGVAFLALYPVRRG
ncbi:MMPL family protein [Enhygromyxa salina]|uniref:MMPL family protein n=1 Tax=Enhygromyxa salina TaxID=215803 RepID=A0A2S9Y7I8_9BACT|nr:MMPL family transporter [Enhygromyxa salina]PRQ01057.1 MMPL family protein [Enhygromyxa salina]